VTAPEDRRGIVRIELLEDLRISSSGSHWMRTATLWIEAGNGAPIPRDDPRGTRDALAFRSRISS
jgi:hypothetical protein